MRQRKEEGVERGNRVGSPTVTICCRDVWRDWTRTLPNTEQTANILLLPKIVTQKTFQRRSVFCSGIHVPCWQNVIWDCTKTEKRIRSLCPTITNLSVWAIAWDSFWRKACSFSSLVKMNSGCCSVFPKDGLNLSVVVHNNRSSLLWVPCSTKTYKAELYYDLVPVYTENNLVQKGSPRLCLLDLVWMLSVRYWEVSICLSIGFAVVSRCALVLHVGVDS